MRIPFSGLVSRGSDDTFWWLDSLVDISVGSEDEAGSVEDAKFILLDAWDAWEERPLPFWIRIAMPVDSEENVTPL